MKKLKEAGHRTVGSVNMECKKKLTQVRVLSAAKVEKILEAAAKISVFKIGTGSKALDAILGTATLQPTTSPSIQALAVQVAASRAAV